MDKTVPAGAALLLDFIGDTETSRKPPQAYNVIYGHNQRSLKKPITTWTLDEVEADGPRRTNAYGSSAAGRYQFMRDTLDSPKTLKDIEGEMGLTGKELFSPDLQDRMGFHLLKRRGYESFMAGKLSVNSFAKQLAQEWASFPVLAATQGSRRKLKRGQSYYAGDGLNKALVAPEEIEVLLARVKAAGNEPATTPAEPTSPRTNKLSPIGALIAWLVEIIKAVFKALRR